MRTSTISMIMGLGALLTPTYVIACTYMPCSEPEHSIRANDHANANVAVDEAFRAKRSAELDLLIAEDELSRRLQDVEDDDTTTVKFKQDQILLQAAQRVKNEKETQLEQVKAAIVAAEATAKALEQTLQERERKEKDDVEHDARAYKAKIDKLIAQNLPNQADIHDGPVAIRPLTVAPKPASKTAQTPSARPQAAHQFRQ